MVQDTGSRDTGRGRSDSRSGSRSGDHRRGRAESGAGDGSRGSESAGETGTGGGAEHLVRVAHGRSVWHQGGSICTSVPQWWLTAQGVDPDGDLGPVTLVPYVDPQSGRLLLEVDAGGEQAAGAVGPPDPALDAPTGDD